MICMIPKYKNKLKQSKPTIIEPTVYDEVSMENLRACFDIID